MSDEEQGASPPTPSRREHARRALDEADAATRRLREAKACADRLLRRGAQAGGTGDTPAAASLEERMRRIEARIVESEALMRRAERRSTPTDDREGG